jgi:hypothetical protein
MNKIEIKTTRKALAYALYGDVEDHILDEFTQDDIDTLIKQKAKDLQMIYEHIDDHKYRKITCEELYSLGDIVNLLENIRFIVKKQTIREKLQSALNDFICDLAHEDFLKERTPLTTFQEFVWETEMMLRQELKNAFDLYAEKFTELTGGK